MAPTPSQAHTLALLERIGGCLSLVAVFLIFIAYGLMARLRNPRNTFIVMASIANLGASIASIIARDGLAAGQDSVLCKAQAFMLQMFIQSDAWWALGMTINTLLVVLGRTNPNTFHAWQYCLVCFGGPFTIAFTLLFVSAPARGPAYGQAYVWCSVSDNWSHLRIFASFIFVWPFLLGSVVLNFIAGYRIFHSRNRVRNLSNSMGLINITTRSNPENTVCPAVVPEFYVTRGPVSPVSLPVPAHTQLRLGLLVAPLYETPNQYLSIITSSKSTSRNAQVQRGITAARTVVSKCRLEDPVKRAYLGATFLFTLSVVVSWTPASINRFHSFLYGSSSFPYQVATVALLPLQGVWNAVIFFATSYKILRDWAQGQRSSNVINEVGMQRPLRGADTDED
ncbi:hypothetical protein EDB80DRAFT_588258 [Ilyonectria destructans]|nr:hypothetical protein EDB80DRAFT_588258 [Ilyonectria destructans]